MKSRMLSILVPAIFLIALSLLSQDARAATFSALGVSSYTINASATGHSITIDVTDTDSSLSITNVTMTLYSFTFVSGTQFSNASSADFSNSTAETSLKWGNNTVTPLIASGGGTAYFMFSVNAPLATGSYNITVTVTHSDSSQNSTNITYSVVDNPVYQITFSTSSSMTQSTNLIEDLSYVVKIKNDGSLQETYNLTVVNCSDTSQPGVGILNQSSITLAAGAAVAVELNVTNDTSGLYSSCIMARHYNDTGQDISNVTSVKDSVILNSGFYPDLAVSAIYWTSSGGDSPYPGGNITVLNATLNNTGHFNFTGDVAVHLFWAESVKNTTVTVANTSLANGVSYNVSFSNITGITAGLHNLTVRTDATGLVTESNEANNNLTAQVFVGYNVTNITVTGNSSMNAYSNKSVNVSVYVYYPNDTAVIGLTKYNFSVYDQQTDITFNSDNAAFNSSFTAGANGLYWFDITTPSIVNGTATLPGTHNLTVTASMNESGRAYFGNSSGLDYYYLLVPKLTVTLSAVSTVTEGDPRGITISVTNTGTDPIYNITLTPGLDSTYLSGGSISCIPILTIPNILVAQTGILSCSATVVAQEVSDDTSTYYMVTATGSYNYSGIVTTYSMADDITILVANAGAGGDTGDAGGTTGTLGKSCTTDNQCGTNESCVSNKCAAISCPNGEIIDHFCMTVTYKINITSFESALSADSGGSNSTKVTVKNTGADKFTAKLEVTINNVTATVSPASYVLDAGESYQFTVDFTVPNTTTVGEFSGTFKAFVSTSTGSYQSKSFKFKVFPKAETKSLINLSYGELESLLAAAMANLSRMKASGMYNQSVISAIESLISAANSTLLQMKSAMDSDDYVTAQSLISQVNTNISSANAEMGGAQVESGFSPLQYGIWFWVAVAVIIIFVVGFFVYMFYPSGHVGFHPEKGYAHPAAREGVGARIKKLFKRKKGLSSGTSIKSIAQSVAEPQKEEGHYETFHYGQDYSKEKSFGYEYSKGAETGGGFLQRFRKKKKAVTPQMHLDQFSGQPVAEQKNEGAPKS